MSRCPHERAFRLSVNMTPSEIRGWSKDPRAKCYSKPETRARLKKLASLKEKPSAKWTEADCKLAARVVSFNARMEGGMRRDGCTPGYSISLRNWGRKTKCSVPKTCSPSKVARGLGKGPVDPKSIIETSAAIARVQRRNPGTRVDTLPLHVVPFGKYMLEARKGPLTPRKVIKAYVLTRSSVQRQGATKPALCTRWPDYSPLKRQADPKKVRPEDAMAAALFLPVGKRYLDAAEEGRFDAKAAKEIVGLMGCYGLTDTLYDDLKAGVALGARTPEVKKALKGTAKEWWQFVEKRAKNPGVPGVGPLQSRFFCRHARPRRHPYV